MFTADTISSLSKWNYVTIAYENSTYIAISEGLSAGQFIIIDGNLNLDHDAEIQIDSIH
ncbi:MAG: hypothetical protein GY705_13985 [Bacteroidetes bacterium]|nr:hypothetical protein [Bacteroidota bacterium]